MSNAKLPKGVFHRAVIDGINCDAIFYEGALLVRIDYGNGNRRHVEPRAPYFIDASDPSNLAICKYGRNEQTLRLRGFSADGAVRLAKEFGFGCDTGNGKDAMSGRFADMATDFYMSRAWRSLVDYVGSNRASAYGYSRAGENRTSRGWFEKAEEEIRGMTAISLHKSGKQFPRINLGNTTHALDDLTLALFDQKPALVSFINEHATKPEPTRFAYLQDGYKVAVESSHDGMDIDIELPGGLWLLIDYRMNDDPGLSLVYLGEDSHRAAEVQHIAEQNEACLGDVCKLPTFLSAVKCTPFKPEGIGQPDGDGAVIIDLEMPMDTLAAHLEQILQAA